MLDDYFSSHEFEAGVIFEPVSQISTPVSPFTPSVIPQSHQLVSSSPFVDSGVSLDLLSSQTTSNNNTFDADDDVFIVEGLYFMKLKKKLFSFLIIYIIILDSSSTSTSSSSNTTITSNKAPMNGLTRSRRSHFSRKESTPESIKENDNKKSELKNSANRIVHEYERLLFYSKSPHSLALPHDWNKIKEKHPSLVKNKVKNYNNMDNNNNNNNNKTTILRHCGMYQSLEMPSVADRLNKYKRSLTFAE